MKDSDLGIPPRPPVIPNGANGPTPQPTEEEKRGRGRPPGSGASANVKPLSTESLISLKEALEKFLESAAADQESIDLFADLQLKVLEIEKRLILKRKSPPKP